MVGHLKFQGDRLKGFLLRLHKAAGSEYGRCQLFAMASGA